MSEQVKLTSMRNAYGDTLGGLGEKYKNIVVLDADLAKSTQTIRFKNKFPVSTYNNHILIIIYPNQ